MAADGDWPGDEVEGGAGAPLTAEDFRAGFGEELPRVLDLGTWSPGLDLAEVYSRLALEVRAAVEAEGELQKKIREEVFPRLPHAPCAPPGAGHHVVTPAEVQCVQRELLFPGGVECSDGTVD